jgi:hypothetical protein
MKPRYSKRTVDEAVRLLDVYASGRPGHDWFLETARDLDCSIAGQRLAQAAWQAIWMELPRVDALEAAQRLREGWRP